MEDGSSGHARAFALCVVCASHREWCVSFVLRARAKGITRGREGFDEAYERELFSTFRSIFTTQVRRHFFGPLNAFSGSFKHARYIVTSADANTSRSIHKNSKTERLLLQFWFLSFCCSIIRLSRYYTIELKTLCDAFEIAITLQKNLCFLKLNISLTDKSTHCSLFTNISSIQHSPEFHIWVITLTFTNISLSNYKSQSCKIIFQIY